MSTNDPIIHALREFDSRVQELTAALALEAARRSPVGAPSAPFGRRTSALRFAQARRLWFVAPVPAEAFLRAGNRIAIIAAHALRPILAARALFGCRDAIRRCVDRQTRRVLSLSIGPVAFAALQEHALAATSAQSLPEDLTADALARAGWDLMLADGACTHPTLRRTVELGLELAAGGDIWQNALTFQRTAVSQAGVVIGAEAATGTSATDEFFSIAGHLFPEFQWLFG